MSEKIESTLEDICLTLVQEAREKCPTGDGSGENGHIKESIDYNVFRKGDNFIGRVGSNNEIAVYVHEGTGIYAVEGKGRKDVP